MTDNVALKLEIAKPQYAAMTDTQIAASINSQTFTMGQDIQSADAIPALVFTAIGDWGNICGVADGVITAGVSTATRLRCISVRELFIRSPIFRATDDAQWASFLVAVDALITDARMSAAGRAALVALRTRTRPLWAKFGGRELDFNDITMARAS